MRLLPVVFITALTFAGPVDGEEPQRETPPTSRDTPATVIEKAFGAATGTGDLPANPESCAACAMGLTAGFVFKRLDVNQDKLVTVNEFMRSPGMQDLAKARTGKGDKSNYRLIGLIPFSAH